MLVFSEATAETTVEDVMAFIVACNGLDGAKRLLKRANALEMRAASIAAVHQLALKGGLAAPELALSPAMRAQFRADLLASGVVAPGGVESATSEQLDEALDECGGVARAQVLWAAWRQQGVPALAWSDLVPIIRRQYGYT